MLSRKFYSSNIKLSWISLRSMLEKFRKFSTVISTRNSYQGKREEQMKKKKEKTGNMHISDQFVSSIVSIGNHWKELEADRSITRNSAIQLFLEGPFTGRSRTGRSLSSIWREKFNGRSCDFQQRHVVSVKFRKMSTFNAVTAAISFTK